MSIQCHLNVIQALEQVLITAKVFSDHLEKQKVEITIGDMVNCRGRFYFVIKTPMFNNGEICAVRIENGKSNWIRIEDGVRASSIKFLKVTKETRSYGLQELPDWIEEKYCTVKG